MNLQLSDEEKKAYCDSTLEAESGLRMGFLILAERLYNIREQRLYEPFWDSWHTFTMEFKELSPGSISKLVQVHETFVEQYHFSREELSKAGGWTKLYAMLKHINTKEDATKWIEAGETLSRQDLTKELTEAKSGVEMRECSHTDMYTVRICRNCGERVEEFSE